MIARNLIIEQNMMSGGKWEIYVMACKWYSQAGSELQATIF